MSFKTKSDLIEQVLEGLGVLGEGQTASIEQIERVDTSTQPILDDMAGQEIYYLNDVNNIPSQAFKGICAIVAWGCRTKFGVTGDDLVALKSAYDEGVISLKRQSYGRPTYAALKTEFF